MGRGVGEWGLTKRQRPLGEYSEGKNDIVVVQVDQYYMTTMGTMVVQGMPLSHHVKAWYPFQNVAPVPRVAMMDYSNRLMPG